MLSCWSIGLITVAIRYYYVFDKLPFDDVSISAGIAPRDEASAVNTSTAAIDILLMTLTGAAIIKLVMLLCFIHEIAKHHKWAWWGKVTTWRNNHLTKRQERHEKKAKSAEEWKKWHQNEATRALEEWAPPTDDEEGQRGVR